MPPAIRIFLRVAESFGQTEARRFPVWRVLLCLLSRLPDLVRGAGRVACGCGRCQKLRGWRCRLRNDGGRVAVEVDQYLAPVERRCGTEVSFQILTGFHDRIFSAHQLVEALALDMLTAL